MYVRSAALQQIFQMFPQRFVVVAALACCFLCRFFHWPFSDIYQHAVRIRRQFQTCDFPSAAPSLLYTRIRRKRIVQLLLSRCPEPTSAGILSRTPASAVRNSKGALVQRDYHSWYSNRLG